MTVKFITKTEQVKQTVVKSVSKNVGVQYTSDSSDRAIRVTPSSSLEGRFTFTTSNPDSDNEMAIVLKRADAISFLENALRYVRGY